MALLVVDADVFVAAMLSDGGASRAVLRQLLTGVHVPVFGNALWLAYEDVLGRPALWKSLRVLTPAHCLEGLA